VFLWETVGVAEEHAAAALDSEQLQLAAAGRTALLVHLFLGLFFGEFVLDGGQGLELLGLGFGGGGELGSGWGEGYFLKHWEHIWLKAGLP
jgi:hypothetical protein